MFEPARRAFELMGKSGWIWKDARFITADVEIDANAAAKWLPLGLKPLKPGRATVFIVDYPYTSFGSVYREAGLFIHVRCGLLKGRFCAWMLVDDDTALVFGREMLGFPKKLGEFTFSWTKNKVQATVKRQGVTLLSLSGKPGQPRQNPKPMMANRVLNAWGPLGPINMNLGAVITMKPSECITESLDADLEVSIQGTENDPLTKLSPGRVLSSRLVRADFAKLTDPILPILPVGPSYLIKNLPLRYL